MSKSKKTANVNLRLTPDEKENLNLMAKKRNLSHFKYIRKLIKLDTENLLHEQPVQGVTNLSHEQQIQNSLQENIFINRLLTNPDLTLKSKQIITKEMRSYV